MAREFFKNLPNTTTPLTAPRMNALLDGDEAMGNIRVDSIKGKNLFNKNNVVSGYIDESGNIATHSSWSVSNYIDLEQNTSYIGSNLQYDGSGTYVAIYNSNKELTRTIIISRFGNVSFTTTSSEYYVRISVRNTDLDNAQFEKGSSATDYSEYKGIGYVSGSNANGNYIKYDDGILIQWGTIAKNGFLQPTDYYDTVQGIRWYRSEVANQTLPISFVNSTYSITPGIQNGSTGCRLLTHRIAGKTQSSFSIQLIGVENFQSSGNAYVNLTGIDWTAEGRWK